MSATVEKQEADNRVTPEPTMFRAASGVVPRAAEVPTAAREAALDAVERALAASLRLQRTLPLPPAPQLNEKNDDEAWPRRRVPFDGDVRRLRARSSLEPVAMAVPPPDAERSSAGALLAGIVGAVALAALAALFAVGALPLPFGANAEGETAAPPLWSRIVAQPRPQQPSPVSPRDVARTPVASPEQAALVERFAALRQQSEPAQPIVPQAVKSERIVVPAAPSVRALDRAEIATLYDRSQALIEQGDIASARLMLTRAAEAGDARSALALGTTYDPDVLRKLGVLGVAADPAQAHAWYTKAAELGSPEATLRLERLAQATR